MKRIFEWFGICTVGAVCVSAIADPVTPVDIKKFVKDVPFDSQGGAWVLPHGTQVMDGIPFKIDGAILLSGTNNMRWTRSGKAKVGEIPIGATFDRIHLLAASDTGEGTNGTVVAHLTLKYADDSEAKIELRYGEELRSWLLPWHEAEPPLTSTNSRVAWISQSSVVAQSDKFLRLFHITLPNPNPQKQVQGLTFESAKSKHGLIVAAISLGNGTETPAANTVTLPVSPYPDSRERKGEPARGEGFVKSKDGKVVPSARLRVMAVRRFGTNDSAASSEDPAVGTETTSDEKGHFVLPPLPDNRLYRVLAVADGFAAATYSGVDPKSDPVEIRLAELTKGQREGKYRVRGKILGPDGKPLAWARIEPDGVSYDQGTSWGGSQHFPDEAYSDSKGEFTFARDESFTRLQLNITVAGLAPQKPWLDVTNELQTVQMGVGARLRGKVLKDGKPLARVKVGVAGADRNSEVFAGHYEVTTDDSGVFVFEHLPPLTKWWLYGVMASLKPYGAIVHQSVDTSNHGDLLDIGDVQVVPGMTLSGMLKTKTGEAVPKGAKLNLGYDSGWDSQTATADKDGKFAFDGLTKGLINIWFNQKGWRYSGANRSDDDWNPGSVVGLLEETKTNLVLEIEKGDRQYYSGWNGNGQLPTVDQSRGREISGVEPGGSPPILITGKVLDDKTGQPVALSTLIPGRQPPVSSATPGPQPMLQRMLEPFSHKSVPYNELPWWQYSHTETLSNGTFSLSYTRLTSTPIFRVEAAGYQPYLSEPLGHNTNIVVRLKHGAGPNGVVLSPDGKPAEGATVIYAATREQFSLTGTNLSTYGEKEASLSTKKDGKFNFTARTGGETLYVAHRAGWADESVAKGGDGIKVRLKPWASISGTLVSSNGTAMPGVELAMNMSHDWSREESFVNIQGHTVTDASGHFLFTNAPPTKLEIVRIIPMGRGSWTSTIQTWLTPDPGITNDLGKVIFDQPPPPPMVEQLKRKLGI